MIIQLTDSSSISLLLQNTLTRVQTLGSVYSSPKLISYIEHTLAHDVFRYYGIKKGNIVVALIQFSETSDEIHLNNIVVDSNFRGLGLAKGLLDFLLEKANYAEKCLSLNVLESNLPATRLYNKLGFKVEGVKVEYLVNLRGEKVISKALNFDRPDLLDEFGFSEADLINFGESRAHYRFFFVEPDIVKLLERDTFSFLDLKLADKLYSGTIIMPYSVNSLPVLDSTIRRTIRMKYNGI